MNVVRIMGGLGNQLFQYSFGRVQEMNEIEVCYDLSWFDKPSNSHRPYRLEHLGLKVKKGKFLKQKTIREKRYHPDLLEEKDANFFGYWQYLKYYEEFIPILRKELFDWNKWLWDIYEIYNKMDAIGIHVRRGDYLHNEFLLSFDYYKKAIDLLNPKLLCFVSDDIDWCKINFDYVKNKSLFINTNDIESFRILCKCKDLIISRSTFSWWAAILNRSENKKVICPERFVIRREDKENYNNKIHYPDEWIRI